MDIQEIHGLDDEELAAVVTIHLFAFRGFFLAKLGPRFLRHYYLSLREHPDSIFLVARSQDGIVGFATGFRDPDRFYQVLKSRWLRFVWPVTLGVSRRPRLLLSVIANLRRVRARDPRSREHRESAATVELSSIAVSPAHSSRGLGRALLEAFEGRALELGVDRIVLTTDRDDNEHVVRFYQSAGFSVAEEFARSGGRVMLGLQKSLSGT